MKIINSCVKDIPPEFKYGVIQLKMISIRWPIQDLWHHSIKNAPDLKWQSDKIRCSRWFMYFFLMKKWFILELLLKNGLASKLMTGTVSF